jgi:hypothetical protein
MQFYHAFLSMLPAILSIHALAKLSVKLLPLRLKKQIAPPPPAAGKSLLWASCQ